MRRGRCDCQPDDQPDCDADHIGSHDQPDVESHDRPIPGTAFDRTDYSGSHLGADEDGNPRPDRFADLHSFGV